MTDLVALKAANTTRWNAMAIDPSRLSQFNAAAARLTASQNYDRYLDVAKRTNVPADFIAVVHEREASGDFRMSLAQGDPWDKASIHVPAGRGPFSSWENAAVDALVNCPPFAARNTDWSIGGTLTMLERYNGLGYANGPEDARFNPPKKYPPQPSPYVWSGTNQYTTGKYVRDHVFDPGVKDTQLGCAALLKCIREMGVKPSYPQTQPPPPPPTAAASGWGGIISAILRAFRGGQ